jgi:starvation-inducible DNA-binding protein
MNQELVSALKVVLGNTVQMYYRTHNYHWNVEGSNFPQYHVFLEMIYQEIYEVIDTISEHIRQLDSYVSPSLIEVIKDSKIPEETKIPIAIDMIRNLIVINDTVILSLMQAYKIAEDSGEIGVSNFLQDRVIAHQKHGWMLKATAK